MKRRWEAAHRDPIMEDRTAPAQVRLLFAGEDRAVLEITLHEGRKRQVRRMLEAVGHPVRYLRRVAIGPISVRKLPLGAWRHLTQKEVHALMRMAKKAAGQPSSPPARSSRGPAPKLREARLACSGPRAPRTPDWLQERDGAG